MRPDLDEIALARLADDGGVADVAVPGKRRWAKPRVRRRPRRTRPPAKTLRPLSKRAVLAAASEHPPIEERRPATRAECQSVARPCPWVACKFNLYLDVNPRTGSIRIAFPDLEPGDMKESCALDVAERGESSQEEIGALMNLTYEGARLIEIRALLKIKTASPCPDEPGAALVTIRRRAK